MSPGPGLDLLARGPSLGWKARLTKIVDLLASGNVYFSDPKRALPGADDDVQQAARTRKHGVRDVLHDVGSVRQRRREGHDVVDHRKFLRSLVCVRSA